MDSYIIIYKNDDEAEQYKLSRMFPINVKYLSDGNYDFNNLNYRYMLVKGTSSQNTPWNEAFIYVLQFYYQERAGILQIAFGYAASKFGFRNYVGGSWTAWKIIA